jgi:hypothetical protein
MGPALRPKALGGSGLKQAKRAEAFGFKALFSRMEARK